MNKQTNNDVVLTLDEQIAALIAIKARREEVMELVGPDVQALRELDKAAVDSKNAADQLGGQRGSIWEHIRNIVFKVHQVTVDATDTREQVFTDVLNEFLNPPQVGADKVKLSTAGQYASTGRKFLVSILTEQGQSPEDYADATVKDVRESFRDAKVQARIEYVGKLTKALRYVAKYATVEEYAGMTAVMEAVDALYTPVKQRKDKTSKKAEADAQLRDNQQQAPTEATIVEHVANTITGDSEAPWEEGEVKKQQVG